MAVGEPAAKKPRGMKNGAMTMARQKPLVEPASVSDAISPPVATAATSVSGGAGPGPGAVMPPSAPGAMTGQHDSRRPPIKRVAEQAVEDLEKEMAVDAAGMDVAMSSMFWQNNLSLGCCCLSITECVANGDLVDMSVDSLR